VAFSLRFCADRHDPDLGLALVYIPSSDASYLEHHVAFRYCDLNRCPGGWRDCRGGKCL